MVTPESSTGNGHPLLSRIDGRIRWAVLAPPQPRNTRGGLGGPSPLLRAARASSLLFVPVLPRRGPRRWAMLQASAQRQPGWRGGPLLNHA